MSAFGYGKRVCPGRHLADATLFMVVASVLSVFNLRRSDDESGPFSYSYTGSLVRYRMLTVLCQSKELTHVCSRPNRFPCLFSPRDKTAEELIIADTLAR